MLVWYSNLHTVPVRFARVVAALSCVLFTAVAAHAEQPFMTIDEKLGGAWRVAAEFHPFTTEVRGIPANKLGKSWGKPSELRKDLLPKEIVLDQNGGASMQGDACAWEG